MSLLDTSHRDLDQVLPVAELGKVLQERNAQLRMELKEKPEKVSSQVALPLAITSIASLEE
jgi:hypothetical protein